MIRQISDIQDLIRSGEKDWKQYGEVNATYYDGMVLFNYSALAQFKPASAWNWFEINSRGLIMDADNGDVIARPFRKFWNYGQAMPMNGVSVVSVSEKLDGSLGILYYRNDEPFIATRGSFTSPQATWATDWFRRHVPTPLPNNRLTYLFEIIYPENRVVVDYGGTKGCFLIGARDMDYGIEMHEAELDYIADEFQLPRPKVYRMERFEDVLAATEGLTANSEGFVIRTSDNERYKVKGQAYMLAHRIMTGATFNRVLTAVEQGKYDEMIMGVPDEFLAQVKAWRAEIDDKLTNVYRQCEEALAVAPQGTQKEFALWVQANYPRDMHGYLFAAKSGKPIESIVYRHAFENRQDADRTLVVDEA